jgi:hypothetical protein
MTKADPESTGPTIWGVDGALMPGGRGEGLSGVILIRLLPHS